MSDQHDLADESLHAASHDALTGLVNRRGYERLVKIAIAKSQLTDERGAVAYVDLDRFRVVNHECGHEAGDILLRELAAEIQKAVPESAWVARLGGDEFGILLSDCTIEKAKQCADDVMRVVADHSFVWTDKSYRLTASVGLAEVTRASESMPAVMGNADMACFLAKKQGGGRVYVYSAREADEVRQREKTYWLQQLQAALESGRFELRARKIVNQGGPEPHGPQVRMRLRLRGLDDQAAADDPIVHAVEQYRLVPHVERWVVQTSLSILGRGIVKLSPGRSLAIGVSAQSLGEPSFLDFIVDCFDRTGVAPDRVCFEVTEGSAISLDAQGCRFISVLHGLGCRFMLYVDGSGGPGSLGALKRLAPDYVRVDGAVMGNQTPEDPMAAEVRAMAEHARSLGIPVVVQQGEVVAIAIDWEVGGEKVLALKVHADGSVQRMGNGSPACEDATLHCGSTPEELLPGIVMDVDPELFNHDGLAVLEPISGKLCKLSVHLWREHGGNQAFEVWYGSASAGPGPEIEAFVANAIKRTNPWYAWMKRTQRKT